MAEVVDDVAQADEQAVDGFTGDVIDKWYARWLMENALCSGSYAIWVAGVPMEALIAHTVAGRDHTECVCQIAPPVLE